MRYRPHNVKDTLVEMKDTSEVMVDLAFSAVVYGSEEMAEEVLRLEEHMNTLQYHGHMAVILAGRKPEDAEQLLGILKVMNAAEKVADAADDVATIVIHDHAIPDALREALMRSREATVRIEAANEEAVRAFEEGLGGGSRVIAIRRGEEWLFDPEDQRRVKEGDRVFVRGPREQLTAHTPDIPSVSGKSSALEEAVEGLVEMKDVMDLALGLAYSAALFNSEVIADEVVGLETRTDELKEAIERRILTAAKEHGEGLRGPLHLAIASEVITDAALEIASAVLHDIDPHAVMTEAIQESDEVIDRVTVAEDAPLVGAELGPTGVEPETDTAVIAAKRDGGWMYEPASITLRAGDVLVVKGTRTGVDRLRDRATD